MTGPQPSSDREYLIQIFDRVNSLSDEYKTACTTIFDRLNNHENRLVELEKFDLGQANFARGRVAWWASYKEFILILFSMALGIVLTLVGLK
jgi:hypothetical protein